MAAREDGLCDSGWLGGNRANAAGGVRERVAREYHTISSFLVTATTTRSFSTAATGSDRTTLPRRLLGVPSLITSANYQVSAGETARLVHSRDNHGRDSASVSLPTEVHLSTADPQNDARIETTAFREAAWKGVDGLRARGTISTVKERDVPRGADIIDGRFE